jgi:hypothetical protein
VARRIGRVAARLRRGAQPLIPPGSVYRPDHAAEDWSVLAAPARRTRPWHDAKWRPLPGGGSLTLGADAKVRWEAADRPLFGVTGAEADSYLLHRVMLHADWRPSRHVQAFVQLAHHDSEGRSGFFPLDRGGLDFQQAFMELRGGEGLRTQGLRLGRQEMAFSPRFVNPRDGVNIRSAYDGARGWVVRGPWRAEAFATRPVANGAGDFDDEATRGQTFSGLRLSYAGGAKAGRGGWSGSAYRLDREAAGSPARPGRTTGDHGACACSARRTAGTWTPRDTADGPVRGTGDRAWGGGADAAGRRGACAWAPRAAFGCSTGRGDDDLADGTAKTFVGPFASRRAAPTRCG